MNWVSDIEWIEWVSEPVSWHDRVSGMSGRGAGAVVSRDTVLFGRANDHTAVAIQVRIRWDPVATLHCFSGDGRVVWHAREAGMAAPSVG